MQRASQVVSRGAYPDSDVRDQVTLGFEDRYRRRIRLKADRGLDVLLDLAEAQVLQDGDGLKLDQGGYVRVKAADEDLVEIRAASPGALARLAWHLGNRHLPAAIAEDRILIRDDHVIVDMLRGLGAEVRKVRSPFAPEGGAYGQHNHDPSHRHAHPHDHDHGNDHAHPHEHRHD